jgi:hypothetical protein
VRVARVLLICDTATYLSIYPHLSIYPSFCLSIQAWLTQMLETAAAHVVAQKHMDWLDAQRVCADRIQGARNCHSPAGWLADPTIDAV